MARTAARACRIAGLDEGRGTRKRSRSRTCRRPTGVRGSCDSTTVQPSSAACRKSAALTSTLVSGKSSKARDPARIGAPRAHEQVADEADRPVRAADDDRLVAARVAAGADDRHARQHLLLAVGGGRPRPGLHEAQLGLVVGGLQPRVGAQRELPLVGLGDDPGAREGRAPSAVSSPPAWSKWRWLSATTSTLPGSKPASRSAGRMGSPRTPRCARWCSSIRSPMPVSTSTRPAGVSTSRQLSAW